MVKIAIALWKVQEVGSFVKAGLLLAASVDFNGCVLAQGLTKYGSKEVSMDAVYCMFLKLFC